jgi:hypothetical protein
MVPRESGINVWLQNKIIDELDDAQAQALIQESATHGTKRYEWLLNQMNNRGYSAISEEYHRKKLADDAQRRLRDKQRMLQKLRVQLATETNAQRLDYLQKRVQKIEVFLENAKPK